MGLVVTIDGVEAAADELRSLRGWLLGEDELRGRVQTRETPPAADRLGPVLDGLAIVADPVAAVLSASLVAWLRTRVGDIRVVLTPERGPTVEITARRVRGLDAEGVAELTERLTHLAAGDAPDGDACAHHEVSDRHAEEQRSQTAGEPDA